MKTITSTRSLLIPVMIVMAVVFSPVQINAQKKKEVDLVSEQSVSRHVRPFIEKEKKLIYRMKQKQRDLILNG